MDLHHITLTADRDSRLPLFAGEAAYQATLQRLGEIVDGRLVLFALVGEHLHLVTLTSRTLAGRLAQRIILSLRPIVATEVAPSHIRPVESRSHMRWLLRYLLEQPVRHGMPGHPALWVGSCFSDLVGARIIEGLSLRIAEALPDYQSRAALDIVGLPGCAILPANRSVLRAAGAHRIKIAAAAALGTDPRLRGNSPPERCARRAVAQLSSRVGIGRAETAAALQTCSQTAGRLQRRPVDASILRAVARRIALEDLVAGSLMAPPTSVQDRPTDRTLPVSAHPGRSIQKTGSNSAGECSPRPIDPENWIELCR